jgi:7-cyano-7-deazaguanine synthase in queuosine biosynthesis
MLYPNNTAVKDNIFRTMKRAYLPERPAKTLIMISGGLDSVVLLANFLAHTNHEVHAHHIEIHNKENRWEIENRTLERVLPTIRERYRPFTYSTSKYELMMGMGGGLDMTLATFMAARVTTAEGTFMDLVVTGHVAASTHEYCEAAAVHAACYVNSRVKPIWITPLSKLSKFDIYNSIPPDLADLTWSCRRPIELGNDFQPCLKCHACKTRMALADEVAQYRLRTGAA